MCHCYISWIVVLKPLFLSQTSLVPHIPSLLLYTTSAQTHIFPEIRVDAVQLLDILLRVVPECVVLCGPSDHGHRVLQGYLDLLNVSGRHQDDQDLPLVSTPAPLSAAPKLLTLNSLNTFLEFLTSIAKTAHSEGDQEEPWFLTPSFATKTAYQNFIRIIQPLGSSQLPYLSWQDRADAPVSAPSFSLVQGRRPWSVMTRRDCLAPSTAYTLQAIIQKR